MSELAVFPREGSLDEREASLMGFHEEEQAQAGAHQGDVGWFESTVAVEVGEPSVEDFPISTKPTNERLKKKAKK